MLTQLPAWQALLAHHQEIAPLHLRDMFEQEDATCVSRAERYTLDAAGLTLDYAKNRINGTTLKLLADLAEQAELPAKIAAMQAGERINRSEHRAALHMALRNLSDSLVLLDGEDVMPQVRAVWRQMERFCHAVRSGQWRGASGAPITDIINIGIGGSDLGPRMVCRALGHLKPTPSDTPHAPLRTHFVANLDGAELAEVLAKVNPASTLVIVCSKTFTTLETMTNAESARAWFLQNGVAEDELRHHFVAVSTNREKVQAFGIDPSNMFEFWDWVGGRFSLWSAVGLVIAVQFGFANFRQLLAGAAAMDTHFLRSPTTQNMPMLLALLGIWNRDFFAAPSLCIAPYAQIMEHFPAWLQQLDMESNGKSVTVDGQALRTDSAPIVWGQVGSNGQHAFFQMIHQGTQLIPVDFIAVLHASHPVAGHHSKMLANCFAQSEALMRGRTLEEVGTQSAPEVRPHQVFPGNRPSNTLLLPRLDAYHLGALLALYEHKIFVQSAIWHINAFDQWGVELGKVLAKPIEAEILRQAENPHDSSTAALIARAQAAVKA